MFKEFPLKDLFTSETGDTDLKKDDLTDVGEYLITSGLTNNGIAGKTDRPAKTIPGNTITVDMFGNVYYRDFPYKMVTHARVFALLPFQKMNRGIGLYMAATMHFLSKMFSYNDMCSWEKIRNLKIQLPVKYKLAPDESILLPVIEAEEIDYEYMERCISELEAERISELKAYLKVTGLDDYELMEEERKALFQKTTSDKNETKFKEYVLNDVFNLQYGNKFDKNKMTYFNPSINFVSRTANNNGVSAYVDRINGVEPHPAGCLTLAFGGSIGSCFVQDKPFYTGQNVGVIKLPEDVSKEAALFIASCIEKKCKNMYVTFSDEINKHFKTDLSIFLPVTPEGTPDYPYMKTYIRAIEKVTIAKLYNQRDLEIKAAKEIVGKKA